MVSKEYAELRAELRLLIKLGLGDGEEADKIRDEMDYYWYRMTEDEKNTVRNDTLNN